MSNYISPERKPADDGEQDNLLLRAFDGFNHLRDGGYYKTNGAEEFEECPNATHYGRCLSGLTNLLSGLSDPCAFRTPCQ